MKQKMERFKNMTSEEREQYIRDIIIASPRRGTQSYIIKRYRKYCKDEKIANCIKTRDGNECRVCGKKENLQVHHIIHLSTMLDKYNVRIFEECVLYSNLFNPLNCITVCDKCHRKLHENDERLPQNDYEKVKIDSDILIKLGGNNKTRTLIINKLLNNIVDQNEQINSSWINRVRFKVSNLIWS